MGLIGEINLVLRAAKRLAIFKRAAAKGLSAEDARREAEQHFPMTAKDIEYETYLRQTNKHPFSRIPWISTIALVYPILGILKILSHTSDPFFVMGYGIGQMGYVLLAAGIISGKFGVFNLSRRPHTLLCGGICLAIGFLFSSVPQ